MSAELTKDSRAASDRARAENAADSAVTVVASAGLFTVVGNVSDMTAIVITPSIDGKTIKVLGYSEINDGGGGYFRWDAASVVTVNNGTVFGSNNSATGRWVRIYDGMLNAKWFGAKGDGVTDDTDAIQRSFDNASLITKSLFIPNGTYNVEPIEFSDNISVFGESVFGTVLKYVPLTPPTTVDNQTILAPKSRKVTYTDNVVMRNFSLDGNKDNVDWSNVAGDGNAHGFGLWGVRYGLFDNVYIKNCNTDGVYVVGGVSLGNMPTSDVIMTNIIVEDCKRQGLSVICARRCIFDTWIVKNIGGTDPHAAVDVEPNGVGDICEDIHITNWNTFNCGEGMIISSPSFGLIKRIYVNGFSAWECDQQRIFQVKNSTEIYLSNLFGSHKIGTNAYDGLYLQGSTKVYIKNIEIVNATNHGIRAFASEYYIDGATIRSARLSGIFDDVNCSGVVQNCDIIDANSSGSTFAAISCLTPNVLYKNVTVSGSTQFNAVRLNSNGIKFFNCNFKSAISTIFRTDGYTYVIKNSYIGNLYTRTNGVGIFSGDGVNKQFVIPHGMGLNPSTFSILKQSAGAFGDFYATSNATNLVVVYNTAPTVGTNNVVLAWVAEL